MVTKWISTDGGKDAAGFVEKNDCAVRALAVFTGKPYAECHATLKSLGRKQFRGTSIVAIKSVLKQFPYTASWTSGERLTLGAIARKFPTGKVYMVKRGHAFAMIDGIVHDSFRVGSKSVINHYWVDPTSVVESKVEKLAPTPYTALTSKKDVARAIFDRLSGTMSRREIAKQMAVEMHITLANASYYCTRVF